MKRFWVIFCFLLLSATAVPGQSYSGSIQYSWAGSKTETLPPVPQKGPDGRWHEVTPTKTIEWGDEFLNFTISGVQLVKEFSKEAPPTKEFNRWFHQLWDVKTDSRTDWSRAGNLDPRRSDVELTVTLFMNYGIDAALGCALLSAKPGAAIHIDSSESALVAVKKNDDGSLTAVKIVDGKNGSIVYDPETMDAIFCLATVPGEAVLRALVCNEDLRTIENTTEAETTPGEDRGTKIPWEVFAIPPAVAAAWALIRHNRNKKRKKDGEPDDRPEDEDNPEEDEGSTFRMFISKDFDDALVLDDPPVEVGARIVETKWDGRQVERPDLTERIVIHGAKYANVSNTHMNGRYKVGEVTAFRNSAGENPGTATVTFSFTGPGARFNNNVVFRVEDPPGIRIGECLSFAAGQGKELYMEFELTGAAHEPSDIEFNISNGGDDKFDARIEQSDQNPQIFRIILTECGQEKDRPAGTTEVYPCTVTVSFDKRKPLEGTFTVYRIYLGLYVRLRALKAFLVEFDSTEEHDYIPKRGSKKRLKFAESRVDLSLTVVDEEDDNQFKTVLPDEGPFFEFSDDLSAGSTLFTQGQGYAGVPDADQFYAYQNLFFRDIDGNQMGNICEKLKFKYEFRDKVTDSSFWGVIRATDGFLVAPNRSHAKVKVTMGWHGQTFTEELVVPVNSQPYRDFEVPPGLDLTRALYQYDQLDLNRTETLKKMQWNLVFEMKFAELRPLFYKITVMLEGYNKAFGYFEPDYQGVEDIFHKFTSGEIGTYYAVRETLATNLYDDMVDAAMATATDMRHSWKVIACRIGLGLVSGGLSEFIFVPADAYLDMKTYVDKGGDSAWEGFKQVSINILKWEALFYGAGKIFSKVKQLRAARLEKLQAAAKETAENTRVDGLLNAQRGFSSAPTADKFTNVTKKTMDAWDESVQGANNAIRKMRQSGDKVFKESSVLAEECGKLAREDGKKIYDQFKKVMNNPTATEEEVKRATLALQGNKSAQEILKNQADDLIRANFNANIKRIYDQVDPVCIRNLANHFGVEAKYIRVAPIKATGNAADALYLGRTIGADRDVTYQIWNGKKWVDIAEDVMEVEYAKAFNEVNYNWFPAQRKELLKTLQKFDQDTVNGLHGLESYGDDLGRIIDKALQGTKLSDPQRIAKTFVHKCQKFVEQGEAIKAQAEQLLKAGFKEEAMRVFGYGEALVQEGLRQNVKQFRRILLPRIEAAAMNGKELPYRELFEKIRVLEGVGLNADKQTLSITLEEARLTLMSQYGSSFEDVFNECAKAIEDVNAAL